MIFDPRRRDILRRGGALCARREKAVPPQRFPYLLPSRQLFSFPGGIPVFDAGDRYGSLFPDQEKKRPRFVLERRRADVLI